jgi:hypothetical protein
VGDEDRLEAYARARAHAGRAGPFRACTSGLVLPRERKSVEPSEAEWKSLSDRVRSRTAWPGATASGGRLGPAVHPDRRRRSAGEGAVGQPDHELGQGDDQC